MERYPNNLLNILFLFSGSYADSTERFTISVMKKKHFVSILFFLCVDKDK